MSNKVRKILVISTLREGLTEIAQRHGFGHVKFVFANTEEESAREIQDADVVILGNWNTKIFQAAKSLKWVHADSGGINHALFPDFVNSSVPLTCLKPAFSIPGAESAIASMLMFSRRMHHMANRKHGPDMFKSMDHMLKPDEIAGKTVCMVGLGYMGRTIAARAKNMGMRVLATARTEQAAPEGVDKMVPLKNLPELLQESDYVMVSVPITDDTTGLVDKNFLGNMKTTAFLIDISGRLPIFDWKALINAIEGGGIAGVCLQPSGHDSSIGMPAPDSDFWKLDNVVITPCRITSNEIIPRHWEIFFKNLKSLQDGKPLEGLVNKKAGY